MDKVELLYDHYKDTFSQIKESLNQRNSFFVKVFLTMTLQFLFAMSPESIISLITLIINNKYEVDITGQTSIIQCLLWITLLYFTIRYYQTTVYIERQYKYIHNIESTISDLIETKFDREGGDYLHDYPLMNDMIDKLYKWVFPIMYCLVVVVKIISEYYYDRLGLPLAFDTIVFLTCFILTILYLIFLHKRN